jgi:hypothetical protein
MISPLQTYLVICLIRDGSLEPGHRTDPRTRKVGEDAGWVEEARDVVPRMGFCGEGGYFLKEAECQAVSCLTPFPF